MRVLVCLVPPTASVPWRIAENVFVLMATSEQSWKDLTILAHVRFRLLPVRTCVRTITSLCLSLSILSRICIYYVYLLGMR